MSSYLRRIVPVAAASAAVVALVAAVASAQVRKAEAHAGAMAEGQVIHAVAVLHPTKSGGEASGVVTFTKASGGVKVEARITGLTPGMHGFHIHEFGDTSSPDAMSAGGHFNPKGSPHAGPGSKRHVGDLGNIEADSKGVAVYDKVDSQLMFEGESSILGRGVIVHEKADDLKSQPAGAAGGRVAAGVIGVGKAK